MPGPTTYFRALRCCALVLLLIVSTGCLTFYYKEFVVAGKPRTPSGLVDFRHLVLGIDIDGRPSNEESFRDSTYYISLGLFRHPGECTDKWRSALKTAKLGRFILRFSGTQVDMKEHVTETEWGYVEFCSVDWDFDKLIISDKVDTIYATVTVDYEVDGVHAAIDTTVALYRLTGKEKEIWKD